jgi:hypothetical protein
MNNKDLTKAIDQTLRNLVDVETSVPTNSNSSGNLNHPSNWSEQRLIDYALEQVITLARLAEWRDNPKADPPFRGYEDIPLSDERQREVDWIDGTPNEFLYDCIRYKIQIEEIDPWLKLTPEQRYQERKKDLLWHECSVWTRYGNCYASPDKPGCSQDLGCIEECRYYEPTGSISDEEVLSWYSKEIGNIGYDQLKHENDELLQAVIKEVKRQAKAY